MSVVDVLAKLGVPSVNLSFQRAVKIVLSTSLQAMRETGVIPIRSLSEFKEVMQPFTNGKNYNAKAASLDVVEPEESE